MMLAEGLTVCDKGKWCDIITHNCFLTGILTDPRDPRFDSRLGVWLGCRSILDPRRLHVGTSQIVSCVCVCELSHETVFSTSCLFYELAANLQTHLKSLISLLHHTIQPPFFPLDLSYSRFLYMNCTHLMSDQTVLYGSELPQHKSRKKTTPVN